jgi:hypothetical protein
MRPGGRGVRLQVRRAHYRRGCFREANAIGYSGRGSTGAREPFRESVLDADELQHQPGEIIFSGRTHSSNSSLVR